MMVEKNKFKSTIKKITYYEQPDSHKRRAQAFDDLMTTGSCTCPTCGSTVTARDTRRNLEKLAKPKNRYSISGRFIGTPLSLGIALWVFNRLTTDLTAVVWVLEDRGMDELQIRAYFDHCPDSSRLLEDMVGQMTWWQRWRVRMPFFPFTWILRVIFK